MRLRKLAIQNVTEPYIDLFFIHQIHVQIHRVKMPFFCTLITFFIKFKGSDEVHGGICSKQHFPMGASSVFDDEDAYGLFAHLCIELNVFTLVLSAIA